MRILKLSAYYAPERVSASHLSRDLEAAWTEAGFTIENHVPTPTRGVSREVRRQYQKLRYEELYGGAVTVYRFPMFGEGSNPVGRALRYMLVNIIQYFRGSRAAGIDLIYGGSTPPTQGVLCALTARRLRKKTGRRVPFVYNLQDVFPQSLATTGLAGKGSLLYRLGERMARFIYREADAIITISQDIRAGLLAQGVPEDKIHVIYNWIDTQTVQPVSPENNRLYEELSLRRDTFKVVYAGNLGKAQGLDTLLEAARALAGYDGIEFLIFGQGAEEAALKQQARELANVRFFPLQPQERVPEVYSLGDVCAVCCKPGTGAAGMPSKTFTVMACGRPLLLSFDLGSELQRTVESAGAGLCAPAGDSAALAQQVLRLYRDREGLQAMGRSARQYAVQYADREAATARYIQVLRTALQTETVPEA